MKKVAVLAVLMGFCGSTALAGTVSFGPSEVVIDLGAGDATQFNLEMTVTEQGVATNYNAVDVVVGSDALTISGFNLLPTEVNVFFQSSAANTDVYASGWKFGYFGTNSTNPNNQFLGTLTVDASGLAEGTYFVNVDSERDNGQSKLTSGTDVEPLFGSATVTIIPEPATLALLGIGGIATALRRRRIT